MSSYTNDANQLSRKRVHSKASQDQLQATKKDDLNRARTTPEQPSPAVTLPCLATDTHI